MRKALNNKRRFSFKDVLIWISICILHFISFSLYLVFFIIINIIINDKNLFHTLIKVGGIIFIITLASSSNIILHILYRELGSPWTRILMWFNTFLYMILIPIILFHSY